MDMQSTGFDFLTLFSTMKSQTAGQAMSGSSTQKGAIKNAFKLLFQQMLGKNVSPNSESESQSESSKRNVKTDSDENSGAYLIHGQLVQMSPQKQKATTAKNQTEIKVGKNVDIQNMVQSENLTEVDGSLVQGEAGKQLIMDANGKIVNKNRVTDSSTKLVGTQTQNLKAGKTEDSQKTEQKITQQINLSDKSEQSSKIKSKMIGAEAEIKQSGEKVQQSAEKGAVIDTAEKNTTKSSASAMRPEQMQSAVLGSQSDSEVKKTVKKEQSEGSKVITVDDVKKNTDVDKVKVTTDASNSHQTKSQASENGNKQFQNLADKSGDMKIEVQATGQKTTSENESKAETSEFQVKSETKSETVQFGSTTKTVADHVENLSQRPVQFAEQVSSVAEKASSSAVLREPIAEQVAPAMARMIRGNHSKMTLTLKPQELGALKIELHSQQGVVGAKFLVESQEVRHLVENSLPELKSMMERQGIQVDSVEVEVRTNSDGATSSQARFARNGNSNGQSSQNQQGGYRHEQQTDDSEQNWKRPSRQYGYNSVEYIA